MPSHASIDVPRRVTVLSLRRVLHGHRRCVGVLSLVLAFGVFAHHTIPEPAMGSTGTGMGMGHHGGMAAHHGGMELMAMCLGLAAAAGLWALRRLARWRSTGVGRPAARTPAVWRVPLPAIVPRVRAGPSHTVVLRL